MSRSYQYSWQRPLRKDVDKVLDEFDIKDEARREDAYELAEEICWLREEMSDLKRQLDV